MEPPETAAPAYAARISAAYSAVEPFAKASVAAVAVCYALGLLIKNIYLIRWATFSANLIEVEYVLSGALFAFVVLLGIALWSCALAVARRARRQRNREVYRDLTRARVKASLKVAGVVLSGLVAVAIFLAAIFRESVATLDYVIALGATAVLFPAFVFLAWRPIADLLDDFALRGTTVPGEAAMRFFLRATLLLVVVGVYVEVVYPKVSPVYGGGKHTQIRLRATEEGARILRGVGFAPGDAEGRIFDVELILEDGTYFTLVAPGANEAERSAVRIHHDHVTSVVTRGVSALPRWL